MIEVGHHPIGGDEKPIVIAEAGTNFGGDVDLGKTFVEEAASAEADVVKFQTHLQRAEMAEGEMRNLGYGDLYERLMAQELSLDDHRALKDHCNDHDVTFLSTAFSVEGVELLDELGVPAIKIGSGELTNYHILRTAAETGRPLLISTGMADMETVRDAVSFVEDHTSEYALLYCVSSYPTDPADFNFALLDWMRSEFEVPIGFSDHSNGVDAAKVAIGRGADFVEKHFTITRRLPWGDQEVSIEPEELADLAEFTDLYHAATGSEKGLLPEEQDIKQWAHHSVVASKRIESGTELTVENVTTKRPGTGIPASDYYDVLGKRAVTDLEAGEVISRADVD